MKKTFLVIRFSSIGDIVLTTPVLRCLKLQVENAEIHFVTKKKHACVLASNPYIHKIHVLNENMSELLDELSHEKFDYIIDLHQNIRSNRIKRKLKAPTYSFNKINFQKFLLVNFKINRLPGTHIVDRYLATVQELKVKNDNKGLDYFVAENNAFNQHELPAIFQKGFVAFVIGGTYFTKKLPIVKISEICNSIDYPVILLGGKSEFDEGEKVVANSKGNVLNCAGKITLNQSASLVEIANVVLTNDTGLMHIAAAFKKKILSFWGNTVPAFGMTPYQTHPASKIIEISNLSCRPCSKLGYKKCPKKHFKCMNDISSMEVVDWINRNYH